MKVRVLFALPHKAAIVKWYNRVLVMLSRRFDSRWWHQNHIIITDMEQTRKFLQGTHPFEQIRHPMPHQDMMGEMLAIKHLAVTRSDTHTRGWSKLCLHGHGLHELRSYLDYDGPLEGFDRRYRWSDEIRDDIPHTRAFFDDFRPFEHLRRIRLQWLEPGGYLEPHRDTDHGTDRRVTINIAVNNPPGCEMRFGDTVVPFQAGTMFMIDSTQEHSVHNDSDQARAHLIVDGR